MLTGTMEHVVKHSLVYSYALSQPLTTYVDAYPELQNKLLLEAEHLEYGDHGEIVRFLQYKMSDLSYYDDKIDGEFGILTEYAIKKFQRKHTLTGDGQVDPITLQTLIKIEKQKNLKQIENLSETIYPGLHSKDVKIMQESLRYFGYYTGEIDGIYGPLTTKALKLAEEEHKLELTKEVTKKALVQLYEKNSANEEINIVDEKAKTHLKTTSQKNKKPKKANEKKKSVKKEIKQAKVIGANKGDTVKTAHSVLGTPYKWGGSSPSGFDCSGFIQYVFQENGMTIPRTVNDVWNFAGPVSSRSVGDLVFFETYKPGPSHMGIYIGDGRFIHASESRGVEISELTNTYWEPRYLGTKRITKQ
ncbi:cell wall lytic activity [Virgibacillus halodenitrificans]|uniref:Cell wall lytic activity n=1 Tax=Virgibacillus halodenitrificans TaxID=1482 RepID=A0AAC9J0H2_VIRHA|nr:NlpC/P60 family protein [Virgibacillus halodenitrificans]APC48484.1 cell wall lytic activity [Virgibacillus halodenitrificans]